MKIYPQYLTRAGFRRHALIFTLILFPCCHNFPYFIDYCSVDGDCQNGGANKKCDSGSCVCQTGYYVSSTGDCLAGMVHVFILLLHTIFYKFA